MKLFIVLILSLFSAFTFAQDVEVKVLERLKNSIFDLGIGSRVSLDFLSKNETKEAIFLGRMVTQDGKTQEFLFLDEKKTRILMIDPENLKGFRKSTAQAIVSPIEQLGNTCAAYGFFHFWGQMHEVGFKGTPLLTSTMESDRNRLQFIEEAIDIYYLQNKINITNVMKMYGKRYGFECRNNPFTDPKKAADFIYNKASEGKPVLLDFNTGSDMVASTYEVTDYETPLRRDPRLWVPRRVGQRMASGHVIVAAAAFTAKGRKKILVLDSNWTEPRVWDLTNYLGKKAAVKEMGFHTCN